MAHSILVVDDDRDTVTLIGLVLKRQGFEVHKAQSGTEAFNFLANTLPDLVLLDVMMPIMDGYEVCRRIKANPLLNHLPVVLLSARAESASQMEGFHAGAIDYIAKPISPSDLIARLQAVLDRSAHEPKPHSAVAIAVAGARNGVGATTLAVNLAAALTATASTIFVDFEPRSTAAVQLGLVSFSGLEDKLERDPAGINRESVEAALTTHHRSGLRLLAMADSGIEPVRSTTILQHVLAMGEVCVVDLGCEFGVARRAIMHSADTCVLVVDSEQQALIQAKRVLQSLSTVHLKPGALKLIGINRLGTPVDIAHKMLRAALDHDLTALIGPASEALLEALDRGQPLVLSEPDHPVAIQMRDLAHALLENSPHVSEFV